VNIRLTRDLERWIREKVTTGHFPDVASVVREALRAFAAGDQSREARIAHLQEALAKGIEEADRGDLLDGPKVMRELRASLRARKGSAARPR